MHLKTSMFLILIFLLVVGSAYSASPTLTQEVSDEFSLIDSGQTNWLLTHPRYQQKQEYLRGTFTIRVDEYLGPLGIGYVIIVSKVVGVQIWKYIIHKGPEKRGYPVGGFYVPQQ